MDCVPRPVMGVMAVVEAAEQINVLCSGPAAQQQSRTACFRLQEQENQAVWRPIRLGVGRVGDLRHTVS